MMGILLNLFAAGNILWILALIWMLGYVTLWEKALFAYRAPKSHAFCFIETRAIKGSLIGDLL